MAAILEATNKNGYVHTAEVETRLQCQECSHFCEDSDVESPLYECQQCGTRFTRNNSADGGSHKCPDCNKFAAKVADQGCPNCDEGELDATNGAECPECGEFIHEDDWVNHVEACG